MQLLEFLAQPVQEGRYNPKEANLPQTIQYRLPADEQGRLGNLHDCCEWGELTEAEHHQLIHYEDLLNSRV